MGNRVLRVLAVVGFLFVAMTVAEPVAAQPNACGEYSCKLNEGGNGYRCILEDDIDCVCNNFGCMCGICYCFSRFECVLMPWQG